MRKDKDSGRDKEMLLSTDGKKIKREADMFLILRNGRSREEQGKIDLLSKSGF